MTVLLRNKVSTSILMNNADGKLKISIVSQPNMIKIHPVIKVKKDYFD
jgi:hypothetical protein